MSYVGKNNTFESPEGDHYVAPAEAGELGIFNLTHSGYIEKDYADLEKRNKLNYSGNSGNLYYDTRIKNTEKLYENITLEELESLKSELEKETPD